jgi:hypothetical protein
VRRRNPERRAGRPQLPVHVRVDTLGQGRDHSLPIDGSFVFDWTP